MTRKSLFVPATYDEILGRIAQLEPTTQPHWGKMNVAQMLSHCAEVQQVSNGKDLKGTPFLVKLFGPLIKKMVINDKPYPRGTRTHPQYVQSDERDFYQEKQRLIDSLGQARAMGEEESEQVVHPLFGRMTRDEKGWAMYKHLDHHLTQFGV